MNQFDSAVLEAKNAAAVKAFEAYGQTLLEELERRGISDVAEAVIQTAHVHDAIMFAEGSRPVHVRCRWDFNRASL